MVGHCVPNGVVMGLTSFPTSFFVHPLNKPCARTDWWYAKPWSNSPDFGGASNSGIISKISERRSHCTIQGHGPYDWRDSNV